jgi:hypothetical protein
VFWCVFCNCWLSAVDCRVFIFDCLVKLSVSVICYCMVVGSGVGCLLMTFFTFGRPCRCLLLVPGCCVLVAGNRC